MNAVLGRRLALAALLLVAFAVRLPGLDEPPLEFHASRQYRSIIFARAMHDDSPPTQVTVRALERYEPEVLPLAGRAGYAVLGHDTLVVPRAVSVVAWVLTAWVLYLLGMALAGPAAGLIAAAFYAFVPYGLPASRAYMPEPMLGLLIATAMLLIVRSGYRAGGVAAGLAGFVKFPGVFFTVPPFLAVLVRRHGVRAVFRRDAMVFGVLAVVPLALWSLYATFVVDRVEGSVSGGRFLPELWVRGSYWSSWARQVDAAVGIPFAVIAVVAAVVFARGDARALLLGAALGYLPYGLVFTYAIHTHDYYQLPVLPAVAIAVGVAAAGVHERLTDAGFGAVAVAVLAGGVLVLAASALSYPRGKDFAGYVRRYREAGAVVDHSTATVMLTEADGLPLRYEGRLAGVVWPRQNDLELERLGGQRRRSAADRLDDLGGRRGADWFIVTDLGELERQPDLVALLAPYPVAGSGAGYRVYDLR